jgi:hypothetical protein
MEPLDHGSKFCVQISPPLVSSKAIVCGRDLPIFVRELSGNCQNHKHYSFSSEFQLSA